MLNIIGYHEEQLVKQNNFQLLKEAEEIIFFRPDDPFIDDDTFAFLEKANKKYTVISNKDWKTFQLFLLLNSSLTQNPSIDYAIEKDFVLLANQPRTSRCMILDKLSYLNLLEKNVYSWLKPESATYDFKYFNNKKKVIDIKNYNTVSQWFLDIPIKAFKHTAWSVVLECDADNISDGYLTEKTFIPILLRRPFIVFGSPNTNKLLKNLGFDIFEELIDYSFDNGCLEERVNQFVIQVAKISKNEVFKDKCDHNFKNAVKIVKNKIAAPDCIVQDNWLEYFNSFCFQYRIPNKIRELYD